MFVHRLFNGRITLLGCNGLLNRGELLHHRELVWRDACLRQRLGFGWLRQGLAPKELLGLAGEGLHPALQQHGAMAMHQAIAQLT